MRRPFAVLVSAAVAAFGLSTFAGPAGAGAPGPFTVDGQIKLKGVTGFVGDNLYDTPDAVGQILSTAASPGQKAIFVIRAENEKITKKNRIAIWIEYADCDDAAGGVFYQGQNVTDLLESDALVVGGVAPGDHVDVRLRVKVAPGTECFVVFGMASDKFPGGADFVIADVISTQPGTSS